VLLSGYTCDPNGGSEAANTWYTALELARAGADVRLLTRESDRVKVAPALAEAQGAGLPLGVTYLSDGVSPGVLQRGQIGVYARYAAFQRRVHAWARAHPDWDIGHHVSWGSVNHPVGLTGAIRPLVLGPVGGGQLLPRDLAQWVDGPKDWQYLRNAVLAGGGGLRRLWSPGIRSADLVFTANSETERLVGRLGALRTEPMLPEGVRQMAVPPEFPARPLVVWLGRLLPIKGVRLAVESFRYCTRYVPDAQLWLVGDGPLAEDLRAWSGDLVDDGAVRLLGRLPWNAAQQVLSAARVHLFTGVRDSSSAQTLEASAWGVPTVAIDQFGLQRFCHRSGFVLVPPAPGDSLPQRLGAAMSQVLAWDAALWRDQSEAAREFAAENTFEARARNLLAQYETLLDAAV
jgi:glycosyltransferase involved in cell wall biosynthesis